MISAHQVTERAIVREQQLRNAQLFVRCLTDSPIRPPTHPTVVSLPCWTYLHSRPQ